MTGASPIEGLRICSLLPSSTDIVGRLGLQDYLVACTHCCNELPGRDLLNAVSAGELQRVTVSAIDPDTMTQAEIDLKVKQSVHHGVSLYQLDDAKLKIAHPTMILTQALCTVCATSYSTVIDTCNRLGDTFKEKTGCDVKVLNLEPHSCKDVARTFVEVAEHCGVKERGEALRDEFMDGMQRIQAAVESVELPTSTRKPRVYVVEWLDPPFDGGHWVPEQIRYGGCDPVFNPECDRSKQRSWKEIAESDIDVVLVGCCGYDTPRNLKDAQDLLEPSNSSEAAVGFRNLYEQVKGKVYAVNGNRYYSRPASGLVQGAALIARCAYDDNAAVCEAVEKTGLLPTKSQRLTDAVEGPEGDTVDTDEWVLVRPR